MAAWKLAEKQAVRLAEKNVNSMPNDCFALTSNAALRYLFVRDENDLRVHLVQKSDPLGLEAASSASLRNQGAFCCLN